MVLGREQQRDTESGCPNILWSFLLDKKALGGGVSSPRDPLQESACRGQSPHCPPRSHTPRLARPRPLARLPSSLQPPRGSFPFLLESRCFPVAKQPVHSGSATPAWLRLFRLTLWSRTELKNPGLCDIQRITQRSQQQPTLRFPWQPVLSGKQGNAVAAVSAATCTWLWALAPPLSNPLTYQLLGSSFQLSLGLFHLCKGIITSWLLHLSALRIKWLHMHRPCSSVSAV